MKGFYFAGIKAGIKKKDLKDLGLIFCKKPAKAAAVFTRNKVKAAPVILGQEKIKNGMCQAVLANSGNANCFTGEQGLKDAAACSKLLADALNISEDLCLVSSTGVIGAQLPVDRFETAVPLAVESAGEDKIEDFSEAILTTDTCSKVITRTGKAGSKSYTITGIAKGSGMIRPDMATMLAYVCTDADIDSVQLDKALKSANLKSFSKISVDGDTSTNDTLLVLANGESGAVVETSEDLAAFEALLTEVCLELAKMIVRDGEGATKLIHLIVKGAATSEDAYKICDTIAHSNLVKTAIYGQDPNWGRITAAAGRSGADVNPDLMDLYFGDQALVENGQWLGKDAEKQAVVIMKASEIEIILDVHAGNVSDDFYFCDFSENYVRINADYRS